MSHDTEDCVKIWNWLVVWKLTWKIWQSFTRAIKKCYVTWQWRLMQNFERNLLAVSKLTQGNWRILTQSLESLKKLHFNRLFLTEEYNVSAKKGAEELSLIALKIDAKFEGKLACAFKNDMMKLANFHSLKNSDFILKSKMAELNQNKNSKQPDWPDPLRKLYFTLKKNE